jgi:hypothetical protein
MPSFVRLYLGTKSDAPNPNPIQVGTDTNWYMVDVIDGSGISGLTIASRRVRRG